MRRSAQLFGTAEPASALTSTVALDSLPHPDRSNGPGHSPLLGLTPHQHGKLWVEDSCGSQLLQDGPVNLRGSLFNTSASAVLFEGQNQLHCTMPWVDIRCVVVAYTVGPHSHMTAEQHSHLEDAGFVPPEATQQSGSLLVDPSQCKLEQLVKAISGGDAQ